uniref:G-protein coupled receptors family 1 profile domain-containing protein n=1 Tax=Oreochromis aureus TaxID=47969 RepID=A0AAZ1XQ40_OREAU
MKDEFYIMHLSFFFCDTTAGPKAVMEMTTRSFHQFNTTTAPVYQYAELRHSLNIMSAIFLSLAFVLGVLGNGVVIWVAGFKMKKTVNAVWFLNLAVADFFFCAFLPIAVPYLLQSHWPFGQVMCKLTTALRSLNISVSVWILVVISVDRCVSVVWPVWAHNHRNVRKASYVSLCVWMVNLIYSIGFFFFIETKEMNDTKAKIICFNKRSSTLARKSSHTLKIITAIIITFFLCWAPIRIMDLILLEKHRSTTTSGTLVYVLAIGIPLARSPPIIPLLLAYNCVFFPVVFLVLPLLLYWELADYFAVSRNGLCDPELFYSVYVSLPLSLSASHLRNMRVVLH